MTLIRRLPIRPSYSAGSRSIRAVKAATESLPAALIRPRSRRAIVADLYALKSIPLRSRIRSSSLPKASCSPASVEASSAASRPTRTSPIESMSAFASTTAGETDPGIEENRAVAGFSTTTVPPACLTCHAPDDPSDPVPVRMTAMRRSPNVLAALDSRRSTDGAIAPGFAGRSRGIPSTISMSRSDGTT